VDLRIAAMTPWQLILNGFDVLIVTALFYGILILIRHTRAFQLVKGIVVLLAATAISGLIGLSTLHTVLQTAQVALLVAIPIVFQPELRSALERLGRARILSDIARPRSPSTLEKTRTLVADAVARAVLRLSRERVGALIVLERRTGLADLVASGIPLGADVSWQILVNIFTPNTPLHDGAAILRGERVLAAGCFLPLSAQTQTASDYGTRHRAALGVSEISDALAIVVSEETGVISIALEGRLVRRLDEKRLRAVLETDRIDPALVSAHG